MLSLWRQQQPNKMNKRAAVSSHEKQLATGNKRRRVAKAAVKLEEEFREKKEEEREDELHQLDRDDPEVCLKPPAAVEEEIEVTMNDPDVDVAKFNPAPLVPPEIDSGFFASVCCTLRTLFSRTANNHRSQQVYSNPAPNGIDAQKDEVELTEDGEDDFQQDINAMEDGRKPPTVVKKEEEDEVDRDDPEDCLKALAAVKEEEDDETEVKEHGENDFQRDINEPEDSMKPLAAIKKEEEDETETEEKEDREERIELVEDEARNVAKEMEVQMQYETTRLLKSSWVVSSSQMLQNQRMLTKLESLPEQVDEYQAEINRMQDDHEEALAREKELGDRLEKELQCLQEFYSEIEENDPTEVNGDEESSEEQVEEHPEQDSHEMAADDCAGSTEAKAEGCGVKEENTEVCYDQEDSEESSMQVAEETDEECTGRSLEETTRLLESSGVASSTQRLQNQGMLTELEFLQGQVNECEAKINRFIHEEALAREKERGDRLEKERLDKAGWNLQYNKLRGSKPSSIFQPVDNRSPAITIPNDIGKQGYMHKHTEANNAFDSDVRHRCTAPYFSQPMGMSKPSSIFQPVDNCAVSLQSRSINNNGDELWSESSDCMFNSASRFRSTLEEPLLKDCWTQGFDDLCRYRIEKGNCLVPQHYEENLFLGRWVKLYRNLYKKKQTGKAVALTAERIKDLEAIGFVWNKNCAIWETRLDELRKFREVYKHCNVPFDYTNQPLVHWVRNQRRQNSSLTLERRNKLESLCFQWTLPRPYRKASVS
jgi:hypothetical protein